MRLNPKNAPTYKHADQLMVDIRIDGSSLDFSTWYNVNNTLNANSITAITGVVDSDQPRNASSQLDAHFRGAGLAYNDTTALTTCNYAGDNCYVV